MASIRTYVPSYKVQMKKYGSYDPFRFEQVAFAKAPSGKGVIQVNITGEKQKVVKAILEATPERASQLVFYRSSLGQQAIKDNYRATMFEVLESKMNLNFNQRAHIFDVLDQLTIAQYDLFVEENKELVKEFWEYYDSRRTAGIGGNEKLSKFYYKEIVDKIIKQFNISLVTQMKDVV